MTIGEFGLGDFQFSSVLFSSVQFSSVPFSILWTYDLDPIPDENTKCALSNVYKSFSKILTFLICFQQLLSKL